MFKNLMTIGLLALALFWSFWYFVNNPRDFRGSVSKERCDEQVSSKMSAYCIGFGEGYNWAFTQMEIDKQLQVK